LVECTAGEAVFIGNLQKVAHLSPG
jgi:hypothetical protein